MRTDYILLLIIFFAVGVFPLMAQNPVYLGKTSEVAATYKAKAKAKKNNGKGDEIRIKHSVPGLGNLVLSMNDSKQEGISDIYSGGVDNSDKSNFYLQVDSGKLSGYIILKEKKKAYLYLSANGSAYLEETDINTVVCIEYLENPDKSISTGTQPGTLAVTVPTLQSLAGAAAVVLLDFNGQYVSSPRWNGGSPINAAPANLTESEITEAWKIISEDYRPFAINITTSETVYNNAPANRRMRVIFTPTQSWFGPAGGVAYVGSFTWGDNTPCWVFNSGIKGAGEAGSHEVGHTLGLKHDGRTSPLEGYFQGHSSWAPIMGLGYYREQVQWSKGEYAYADNLENDLSIITSQNGFSYRTDDHSNSSTNATALIKDNAGNISASSNKGVITTQSDVDVFSFQTNGGNVSLTITPSPAYANLDILLTLKNSSGNTLFVSDPAGISASVNQSLASGTYYLYVDGTKGSLGANSDYSSVGEYTISGNIASVNSSPTVRLVSPAANATFTAPTSVNLTAIATDTDGTIAKVEFYNGTTKLGEDTNSPYSYSWNTVSAGSYSLTAKAIDNLNAITASVAIPITITNGTTAALPSPWKNQDIGNMSIPGSVSYSNGSFTMKSAGYDFWTAPDNFHYVYQLLSGDVTLIAKVVSIQNTNGNALAGIMIRENLSASASFVATSVNPTGTLLMSRQGIASPAYKGRNGSAPMWLKLNKKGNLFTSSSSTDGINWILLGTVSVTMPNSIYVGMAVTSHNNSVVNTAIFSNVSVTPATTTNITNQPPVVSITSPANNTSFTAGSTITITANAADDGTIAKVEFYNNTTKLGEDTSSPYSYSWNTVPAGSYSLIVKAIDNQTLTTSSTPISITVNGTATACSGTGSISREVWTNMTGSSISAIPLNTTPNSTGSLTTFETPARAGDNYGQRVRGYLCVAVSSSYTFYIAADDQAELYLSTDANPSKKVKIAYIGSYTGEREWGKLTTQKSVLIGLQAGVKYYIEALHKEGLYADHLAVGWQASGTNAIAVIPGANLSSFTGNSTARVATNERSGQNMNNIRIYPNPAGGEKVQVEVTGLIADQEIFFTLFNNVGTLISRKPEKADASGILIKEIPLPDRLSSGIYTLKAETGSKVFYQKLIITK